MLELPTQLQLPSASQQACSTYHSSDNSDDFDDSMESLDNYSLEVEEDENDETDYGKLVFISSFAISTHLYPLFLFYLFQIDP